MTLRNVICACVLCALSIQLHAVELTSIYQDIRVDKLSSELMSLSGDDCQNSASSQEVLACNLALSYGALKNEEYEISEAALVDSVNHLQAWAKKRAEKAFDAKFNTPVDPTLPSDPNAALADMMRGGKSSEELLNSAMSKEDCSNKESDSEEYQQIANKLESAMHSEEMQDYNLRVKEITKKFTAGEMTKNEYSKALKDHAETIPLKRKQQEVLSAINKNQRKKTDCYASSLALPSMANIDMSKMMEMAGRREVIEYQQMNEKAQVEFRKKWITEKSDFKKQLEAQAEYMNTQDTTFNSSTMANLGDSPVFKTMFNSDKSALFGPNFELMPLFLHVDKAKVNFDNGDADSAFIELQNAMKFLSPYYLSSSNTEKTLPAEFVELSKSLTLINYSMRQSMSEMPKEAIDIFGFSKQAPMMQTVSEVQTKVGKHTFGIDAVAIFASAFDNDLDSAESQLNQFSSTYNNQQYTDTVLAEARWYIAFVRFMKNAPPVKPGEMLTLNTIAPQITETTLEEFAAAYRAAKNVDAPAVLNITENVYAIMLSAKNSDPSDYEGQLKEKLTELNNVRNKSERQQSFTMLKFLKPSMEYRVLAYL